MTSRTTLLEFLEQGGSEVWAYDMGRRIGKLSREQLLAFEQLNACWPFPVQQQAWLALVIRNHQLFGEEPLIWFVHFSLDETGQLVPAGRDYFLHRLFEAGTAPANTQANTQAETGIETGIETGTETGTETEIKSETGTPDASDSHIQPAGVDALKDNPQIFKPREDMMAVFHAQLSQRLQQPASRFLAHALEYFSGKQGWEQWNFVGFQGIADLVARVDQDNHASLIKQAIRHLPAEPLQALCQCLEHTNCPAPIGTEILHRAADELQASRADVILLSHLARALAQAEEHSQRQSLYDNLLDSAYGNAPECLAAIGARAWDWLNDRSNAANYLAKLATTEQAVFNACLSDLLFMPGLRDTLLGVIRDPQRPDELAEKFSGLLSGIG